MPNNKAFCIPYPEDSDHPAWTPNLLGMYMLVVQSPSGAFMLLSGGWPSIRAATISAERFGYTMLSAEEGMTLFDKQMETKFGAPHLRLVQ